MLEPLSHEQPPESGTLQTAMTAASLLDVAAYPQVTKYALSVAVSCSVASQQHDIYFPVRGV